MKNVLECDQNTFCFSSDARLNLSPLASFVLHKNPKTTLAQ
jgi:hypothetical protein